MSMKRENLKDVNGVKVVKEWLEETLLDHVPEDPFSAKLIRAEYALPYPARARTEAGK